MEEEGSNKRKCVRTRLRAEVKLHHPDTGELDLHTRDISDSGAFILSEGKRTPEVGEVVEVQVQGLPGGEAPVVRMRIIRIDDKGMGLEFIND